MSQIHSYNKIGIYIPEILNFDRARFAKIDTHNVINRYFSIQTDTLIDIFNITWLPAKTNKIDVATPIRKNLLNINKNRPLLHYAKITMTLFRNLTTVEEINRQIQQMFDKHFTLIFCNMDRPKNYGRA